MILLNEINEQQKYKLSAKSLKSDLIDNKTFPQVGDLGQQERDG